MSGFKNQIHIKTKRKRKHTNSLDFQKDLPAIIQIFIWFQRNLRIYDRKVPIFFI